MRYFNLVILLFFVHSIYSQTDDAFLLRTNEKRFDVTVKTIISYHGIGTAKGDLFLGALQTNEYQQVHGFTFQGDGKKQGFGMAMDSCFYYPFTLGKDTFRKKKVQQEYEISTSDIKINFDSVDTLYPYNIHSDIFEKYTQDNLPYIDTQNDSLKSIADSLWDISSDILDYARKCYEYVPVTFEYLDPITGFYPLETILEKGGGDCGNLETVFITLLRIKGIPARHLVGFRPDNSLHVWSDFYLEKYGWVPVDVTYKQSDPEGDYFGNIRFENNGFIVHRGIGYVVFGARGPIRIPSLQTYSYNDSYSEENIRKVIVSRKVNTKKL